MIRPDNFILKLSKIKKNLNMQIMHCEYTLQALDEVKTDVDYESAATVIEKSNIESLITLIEDGLEQLKLIVWE
jgi:RecA-family ATPase